MGDGERVGEGWRVCDDVNAYNGFFLVMHDEDSLLGVNEVSNR